MRFDCNCTVIVFSDLRAILVGWSFSEKCLHSLIFRGKEIIVKYNVFSHLFSICSNARCNITRKGIFLCTLWHLHTSGVDVCVKTLKNCGSIVERYQHSEWKKLLGQELTGLSKTFLSKLQIAKGVFICIGYLCYMTKSLCAYYLWWDFAHCLCSISSLT